MMLNPAQIISELEKLTSVEEINTGSLFNATSDFQYEPIRHYISTLIGGTKPETAAAELLRSLIKDVLGKEPFSEVRIAGGFIDFAVREPDGNPVLIELKPFLSRSEDALTPNILNLSFYKDQIVKYLASNEYLILTNLNEAILFNRAALVRYEPFKQLPFADLLRQFLTSDNLWESLKRLDDQSVKSDLDKSFFEDLKSWFSLVSSSVRLKQNGTSHPELITLLLNKIIFIKTLEDFGLIEFRYLQEEYLKQRERWRYKGTRRFLKEFFDRIETFFAEYYNTELFNRNFFDEVEDDDSNYNRLKETLEKVLGLDAWSAAFGFGMVHYNYRQINEDIFGKAYETFIAEERKDSGIYYTPKPITEYMSQTLADAVFGNLIEQLIDALNAKSVDRADALMSELYECRVIDPTSGSGSFLIKVLRDIHARYNRLVQTLDALEEEPRLDWTLDQFAQAKALQDFRVRHSFGKTDGLLLTSKLILRHICAADYDDRALDTAKTNLWKEAVKLAPRLYRPENIGVREHVLPNLELNFAQGDSLLDMPLAEQLEALAPFAADISELHQLRARYLDNPFDLSPIQPALRLKEKLRRTLLDRFQTDTLAAPLLDGRKPLFFAVEFFYCFFNRDGNPKPLEKQGFDGVISNPPWEAVKPIKKEFARISKGEMNVLNFDRWFEKEIKQNADFKARWEKYTSFYDAYSSYLYSRFTHQSVGDPNYYKLFIERDLALLRVKGLLTILVPSGIQTDKGCNALRKLLILEHTLSEISSFENRGYEDTVEGKLKNVRFFPDVDSRFKFSIVVSRKEPNPDADKRFKGKFYLQEPKQLYEQDPIEYSAAMIEKFSPADFAVMEFRTDVDYELCSKIFDGFKPLRDFGYTFRAGLHMTNDSHLFRNEAALTAAEQKNALKLYEGKMIHQFNPNFGAEQYVVPEPDARAELLAVEKKRLKREFKLKDDQLPTEVTLDYETFRLAYRAIASSTNERTLICTIIPRNVFVGNSMSCLVSQRYDVKGKEFIQHRLSEEELVYVMSLLNSLTLNYFIRNKVSANLTMNFMYELPFAIGTAKQKDKIVQLGATLLYLNCDKKVFAPFFKALGITLDKDADAVKTRAELECLIARDLYGLTKKEWDYLCSTFVYGGDSETKQELDAVIAAAKQQF